MNRKPVPPHERTLDAELPELKPYLSAGARVCDITQEEAMRVIRLFSDPTFSYLEYIIFSAWGRKPIQDTHTHISETPRRNTSG